MKINYELYLNNTMRNNWKIYRKVYNDTEICHVLLQPDQGGTFDIQLDSLKSRLRELMSLKYLDEQSLIYTKIFVTDYINNKDKIEAALVQSSEFSRSAISIVEQPPLNGSKIAFLLLFIKSEGLKLTKEKGISQLELHGLTHMFQSVEVPVKRGDRLDVLTTAAFAEHQKLLDSKQISIAGSCMRTWLYVKDIDSDYKDVVKGRNDYFNAHGLTIDTHFIASTGIGGSGCSADVKLLVDFYSVRGIRSEQVQYLSATSYLNSTAEYGVAFERGVKIAFESLNLIFISGTASIDERGQCLYRGDVLKQAERIVVNIEQLLKNGDANLKDIAQIIVYLRDVSDAEMVSRFMQNHFENVPYIITLAKVCRPEWLIEMECVAMTERK